MAQMNLMFFDVSLFLIFLSIRDYIVLLVMDAFTVSEFNDLLPILVFRLSLKLKFSSEMPMRFLLRLQNYWSFDFCLSSLLL